MKQLRSSFVIFLALVFLCPTFVFETQAVSARTELEKLGYTFTEDSFIKCAEKGEVEPIKMFLAEGININACDKEGRSALMRASLFGHVETVKLLLDNGADIKIKDKETQGTALMEAVGGNHPDVIRLLDNHKKGTSHRKTVCDLL